MARATAPRLSTSSIDSSNETASLLTHEPSQLSQTQQSQPRENWAGFDDFSGLPWHRKPSIYWLIPPFFLFALAFGGTAVPKVNLTLSLICKHHFSERVVDDPTFIVTPVVLGADNPQCHDPEVQKITSQFMAITTCISGILSAIAAPRLGELSDRYGRRKLLGIASLGGVLAEIVVIVAARFPEVVNYRWLILGAVFDGMAGSYTAGSILSHAYTSDCTPPSKRGVAIGYLHACLNTGVAVGPVIAAYFIKATGSLLSIFYVALASHLVYIFLVTSVIPESLSKSRQLASRRSYKLENSRMKQSGPSWLARKNPLQPLRILWPKNRALRQNLVSLAAIDTAVMGIAMAVGVTLILYSGYMFNWSTLETSKFISMVSTVRSLVLLIGGPLLNYWFRQRPARKQAEAMAGEGEDTSDLLKTMEHQSKGADALDVIIIRFALLSDFLGMLGYFFASSGRTFILSGVITALGGLCGASTQGAASKHVPSEQVGQLLGAMGLLQAGSRFILTFIFSTVYAATIETAPNAVFGIVAVFLAGAVVASMLVRTGVYSEEMDEPGTLPPSPCADELVI
ncbi:putative membrane protein C14C4.07 [Ceratocystis fimbriata CBS 114723]|uniref:Putative membrane protein C14C4.07 n=1 Tax=Ceratocystis fimbriata CBS 114723 TaxID=1035309 RepID=A0A2C5WYH4_9PEZI|nr:putative membrane protein C14C4.07 [Ceratocystis fimbriata CBS 114723]